MSIFESGYWEFQKTGPAPMFPMLAVLKATLEIHNPALRRRVGPMLPSAASRLICKTYGIEYIGGELANDGWLRYARAIARTTIPAVPLAHQHQQPRPGAIVLDPTP